MDLFDFFFPEQAQAAHLRSIATAQRLRPPSSTFHEDEVAALKTDVRFLTLVVTAILKRLTETKTMSLADVQDLLTEVDAMDGVGDGGLEPGVLRGLLGVLKQDMNAGVRTGEQQVLDKIAQLHRYRK